MKKHKLSVFLVVIMSATLILISRNSYSLTTAFESVGNYRIYAKGVGLNNPAAETTSGSIQFNITGVPIKAFLYWIERDFDKDGVDNTITFQRNGHQAIEITGIQTSDADSYCFKADITDYVLPGFNSYIISGLNNERNSGAGIIVISEDATAPISKTTIKDGCDFFYYGIPGQENSELISFDFESASFDRSAKVIFFVGDAQTETEIIRGNQILYLPSNTLPVATPSSPFTSPPAISLGKNQTGLVANDGKNWDTFGRNSGLMPPIIHFPPSPYDDPDQRGLVTIPASMTYANFQLLSLNRIQNGESAVISTVAFQLILEKEGCTPGYWKQPQHFDL